MNRISIVLILWLLPGLSSLASIDEVKMMYQDTILIKFGQNSQIVILVEDENEPVIWRGPVIANTVKQFWTDVLWGELDYLIIDMPPGTGDVALTVMQSIPINGIVMVSIPQDMVSMIVAKAINMAKKMDIDVIGVVQNMEALNLS